MKHLLKIVAVVLCLAAAVAAQAPNLVGQWQGTLAFQGKIVTKEGFKNILSQALPPGSQTSLLIQADKDVAFNDVVFVMDVAKQLKVEKLGVAVLPHTGG